MEIDFTKPYNQEKENKMNQRGFDSAINRSDKPKRAPKVVKNVVGALALAGLMGWCTHRTINYYFPFSEKDFKDAKWYSSTVNPDEAYLFEKIPHNQNTKSFYLYEVRKMNDSLKTVGLYPDLDGNGKVAK